MESYLVGHSPGLPSRENERNCFAMEKSAFCWPFSCMLFSQKSKVFWTNLLVAMHSLLQFPEGLQTWGVFRFCINFVFPTNLSFLQGERFADFLAKLETRSKTALLLSSYVILTWLKLLTLSESETHTPVLETRWLYLASAKAETSFAIRMPAIDSLSTKR